MSLFVQGLSDYHKGKEPQKEDDDYLKGYGRAYEMAEMQTAQTEREQPK